MSRFKFLVCVLPKAQQVEVWVPGAARRNTAAARRSLIKPHSHLPQRWACNLYNSISHLLLQNATALAAHFSVCQQTIKPLIRCIGGVERPPHSWENHGQLARLAHTSTCWVYECLIRRYFQVVSAAPPSALRKPPVTVETLERVEVSTISGSAPFAS